MRGPTTLRALVVGVVVLLVAAGVYLYVLTEFPQAVNHCYAQTFGVEMMTFDNRTYCSETVSVGGMKTVVNSTNQTISTATTNTVFLGFAFVVLEEVHGMVGSVHVTVTEPNGTTYHGLLAFGGPYYVPPTTWFIPDNESGFYEPSFQANVTLLVEVGA